MFAFLRKVKVQRHNIQQTLTKIIWTAAAVVFVVALTGAVGSVPIQAQTDDDDPIARIDQVLTGATEQNRFSGAVLIARDGEILLEKGYGYAVREWEVPNTPDSKFLIASLTKQFTAMSILMLQEQGLLNVQDPICQYLDDCPEAWADVTIHNLLNHTSGIPDFMNLVKYPDIQKTLMFPSRPAQTIGLIIDEPLDFAPGEQWSYSNSGYIILGKIIEEVSGKSYQVFLRSNIFRPLGMENTGYPNNASVIDHMTQGYAGSNLRASYFDMSVLYAAGGLYSTVGDLYLWDQALFGGQVVSQETWDAMLEAAYPVPDGSQYAYGLVIADADGHTFIGHGGTVQGFSSLITHFTEENTTMIFMQNVEMPPPGQIYLRLFARILFGD